jgi:hypothetical protein
VLTAESLLHAKRVLTAHRLESSDWRIIGTYSDETEARIAPF